MSLFRRRIIQGNRASAAVNLLEDVHITGDTFSFWHGIKNTAPIVAGRTYHIKATFSGYVTENANTSYGSVVFGGLYSVWQAAQIGHAGFNAGRTGAFSFVIDRDITSITGCAAGENAFNLRCNNTSGWVGTYELKDVSLVEVV